MANIGETIDKVLGLAKEGSLTSYSREVRQRIEYDLGQCAFFAVDYAEGDTDHDEPLSGTLTRHGETVNLEDDEIELILNAING